MKKNYRINKKFDKISKKSPRKTLYINISKKISKKIIIYIIFTQFKGTIGLVKKSC